jgi:hypothetical protein
VRIRRRLLIVVLAFAALGGVTAFLLRGDPEPKFEGKPLSRWLQGYCPDEYAWESANNAVDMFGTNAIPTLLSMLGANDSRLKPALVSLAQKQPWIHIDPIPATNRNYAAAMAFRHLGTAATNAIPDLIRIYARNYSHSSRIATLSALDDVGPHNLPLLARGLNHRDAAVREMIVGVLDRSQKPAAEVVPLLTSALGDSSPSVRATAAMALSRQGTSAASALPELRKLIQDKNAEVRNAAQYALPRIDPTALSHPQK